MVHCDGVWDSGVCRWNLHYRKHHFFGGGLNCRSGIRDGSMGAAFLRFCLIRGVEWDLFTRFFPLVIESKPVTGRSFSLGIRK